MQATTITIVIPPFANISKDLFAGWEVKHHRRRHRNASELLVVQLHMSREKNPALLSILLVG